MVHFLCRILVGAPRDFVSKIEFSRLVWFMVFNATFNNISVISWRSVLLVEKTGVPGENHQHSTSHIQTFSRKVVISIPRQDCKSCRILVGAPRDFDQSWSLSKRTGALYKCDPENTSSCQQIKIAKSGKF
jgi:hypothetical protein